MDSVSQGVILWLRLSRDTFILSFPLVVLPRMFPGFVSLYIYKGGDRNVKEDSNSNEPLSLVFLPDTHSNVNLLWPLNCHLVPKFQSLQGITAMWLHVS